MSYQHHVVSPSAQNSTNHLWFPSVSVSNCLIPVYNVNGIVNGTILAAFSPSFSFFSYLLFFSYIYISLVDEWDVSRFYLHEWKKGGDVGAILVFTASQINPDLGHKLDRMWHRLPQITLGSTSKYQMCLQIVSGNPWTSISVRACMRACVRPLPTRGRDTGNCFWTLTETFGFSNVTSKLLFVILKLWMCLCGVYGVVVWKRNQYPVAIHVSANA